MSLIRSNPGQHQLPRSASSGFSLVEVLAALMVTMLLVLAFTPFAGQMLAAWVRGSEMAKLVDAKTRGLNLLRQDLRHAIVWSGFGEHEKLAVFRGNETSISFASVTGLGPERDGLEMLSFTVDSSFDGRALVRRRARLMGTTFGAFRDPVVLFSGPFRYVFTYLARDGRELPVWAHQIELPVRIRLSILDRRGAVFAAPIELPVLASLSAGCLANASLPGCPVRPKEDPNEWMKQYGLVPDSQ